MPTAPGRPRRVSREILQEAAFELFPLRGYRNTSVELIARTAGFSRATFFNCFSSKAELFWLETDQLILALETSLASQSQRPDPPILSDALVAHAEGIDASAIPWALQHYRLLEAADDLVASGATRLLRVNQSFGQYLRARDPEASEGARAAQAAATSGMLLVALLAWINAGVDRGTLGQHLARSLSAF